MLNQDYNKIGIISGSWMGVSSLPTQWWQSIRKQPKLILFIIALWFVDEWYSFYLGMIECW